MGSKCTTCSSSCDCSRLVATSRSYPVNSNLVEFVPDGESVSRRHNWKTWNRRWTPPKIQVLGLNGAGKTTMISFLCTRRFTFALPTRTTDQKRLLWEVKYGNRTLLFNDAPGSKSLRKTWESFLPGTDAYIFVLDASDEFRIPLVKQQLRRLSRDKHFLAKPVLILANKTELPSALTSARIEIELELSSLEHPLIRVQCCSCVTGAGIDEGMDWLIACGNKKFGIRSRSSSKGTGSAVSNAHVLYRKLDQEKNYNELVVDTGNEFDASGSERKGASTPASFNGSEIQIPIGKNAMHRMSWDAVPVSRYPSFSISTVSVGTSLEKRFGALRLVSELPTRSARTESFDSTPSLSRPSTARSQQQAQTENLTKEGARNEVELHPQGKQNETSAAVQEDAAAYLASQAQDGVIEELLEEEQKANGDVKMDESGASLRRKSGEGMLPPLSTLPPLNGASVLRGSPIRPNTLPPIDRRGELGEEL